MAYAACPRDSSCPIAPYTDAAPTAWYHDGVHYCIDNGLMQGVSSTQFLPDGSTTRAQLVTILWRLEGAPAARGGLGLGPAGRGGGLGRAQRARTGAPTSPQGWHPPALPSAAPSRAGGVWGGLGRGPGREARPQGRAQTEAATRPRPGARAEAPRSAPPRGDPAPRGRKKARPSGRAICYSEPYRAGVVRS